MTSCSWLWLYFGALLMLLELLAPGFVIFFFGLSASTVGLVRCLVGESFSLPWQIAAFSFFAILYLVILRRLMKRLFIGGISEAASDIDNGFKGRVGKVTVAIAPPLAGRIELGDAEWSAMAAVPLEAGATVRVTGQENLTLQVEPVT